VWRVLMQADWLAERRRARLPPEPRVPAITGFSHSYASLETDESTILDAEQSQQAQISDS
jgi:hypothetical protein